MYFYHPRTLFREEKPQAFIYSEVSVFFFFEQESFVVSLKIHNFGLDGMYYCLTL